MSHIKKEKVSGFDQVIPEVLTEGIKVAAQLLELQGVKVADFVYDYSGNRLKSWDGMSIICGLGTERGKCRGVGLTLDKKGKLVFVGDDYNQSSQFSQLKKQVTQVLGGACYFAGRAMLARSQGQKVSVNVDKTSRQLQLIVEM